MKKSHFVLAMLLVSAIPFAVVLPMAQPAAAWGLQTHMFIVESAVDGISDTGWADAFTYYLPELIAGSTTPDQAWQDWDNHLYYPDTGEYNAPNAAKLWFDYARANFSAGQWEKGFFAAGVMSHYFADPCIPVHTGPTFPGHSAYESDINENLGSFELGTPSESLVANVSQLVVDCATYSHQYYNQIVAAYPDNETRALDNPTILAITENCLTMAINGTLSLYYTLTNGIAAPDIVISYKYVALVDYAHANDYTDDNSLTSINQTLVREHFQMKEQTSAITAAALADVDLLIVTCGLTQYSSDELTAITNWAASGNKSIIVTARGDFSTTEDIARPNQILNAIGSDIRVNDDNVYMPRTYQLWYDDLYTMLSPSETMGMTTSVSSLTLFSPASLYFLDEGPVLPVVFADKSGYQTDQLSPQPTVIYDNTDDGVNGQQIPLVAIEEIGQLRVLVSGTTFFSNFDYGKTALFSNINLLTNFLDWSVGNRSENTIQNVDEMGPKIGNLSWTPESPESGATVTVTADVIDVSNVDSVWMIYDDGSGPVDVAVSASGDTYTVALPALTDGSITFTIYANDTEGNLAVRGAYTITWESASTTGSTTPTTTSNTSGEPPAGPDPMLVLAVGVAVVIVLIFAVVIIKRRG
jgi:hypothetical protein